MSIEILDVAVPAESYDWLWKRYQELGVEALKAVEERDKAMAENERLREALASLTGRIAALSLCFGERSYRLAEDAKDARVSKSTRERQQRASRIWHIAAEDTRDALNGKTKSE
jgi:hypothetical protein